MKNKLIFIISLVSCFIIIVFGQDILDFINILLSHIIQFQIPGRNSFYLNKAAVELPRMKRISIQHQSKLDDFLSFHKIYLSNMRHGNLFKYKYQAILDVLTKCYENQNYQSQGDFLICEEDFVSKYLYKKNYKNCKLNEFYNEIIETFIVDLSNYSKYKTFESIDELKAKTLNSIKNYK